MEKSDNSIQWDEVLNHITGVFNSKPDMNMVLLAIGIREFGLVKDFSKEEKVKLMHIAVCRLFSVSGYYSLLGVDSKGWPNWEKNKDLPYADIFEQESLLRQHIVHYYEEEEILV